MWVSGPLVIGTLPPGWDLRCSSSPATLSPLAGSLGDEKGAPAAAQAVRTPPSSLEDHVLGPLALPVVPSRTPPSSLHVLVPSDRPLHKACPAPCCQHPTLKPFLLDSRPVRITLFRMAVARPHRLYDPTLNSRLSFRAETKPCPPFCSSVWLTPSGREQTVVLDS